MYYVLDSDKDGNSSQMLSVRVHHKNSYIRTIGDFEVEGDNVVRAFEENGIQWEGTILHEDDGERVHLTGKKGDYIYDVLSQYISLGETKTFLRFFMATN